MVIITKKFYLKLFYKTNVWCIIMMVIGMNRVYLCIDLKCFYASVECVERGLDPFKTNLVVADSSRGKGAICLAVSPRMKELGVKNRCRIFEIPKEIEYLEAKPRMKKYIEYSANIYGIYLKYVAKEDIHVYSIDEAFLDVTSYLTLYKMEASGIAKMIMDDIYETTGITATAGIGTNLYLCKIALDIMAKHVPDHIGILDDDSYKEQLWYHEPLTDFWQIGTGLKKRLQNLGLFNMHDIALCDERILYKELGINAKLLIDHAWGIEPCTIQDIKSYKPHSNSINLGQILFENYSFGNARKVLVEMVDDLTLELNKKNKLASTISLVVGYSKDFIPATCINKKLNSPISSFNNLLTEFLKLFDDGVDSKCLIRRINITFGGLVSKKYVQIDLFDEVKNEDVDDKLSKTVAYLKNRFGKNCLLRGISYDQYGTQRQRNKLIGGHNAE